MEGYEFWLVVTFVVATSHSSGIIGDVALFGGGVVNQVVAGLYDVWANQRLAHMVYKTWASPFFFYTNHSSTDRRRYASHTIVLSASYFP